MTTRSVQAKSPMKGVLAVIREMSKLAVSAEFRTGIGGDDYVLVREKGVVVARVKYNGPMTSFHIYHLNTARDIAKVLRGRMLEHDKTRQVQCHPQRSV